MSDRPRDHTSMIILAVVVVTIATVLGVVVVAIALPEDRGQTVITQLLAAVGPTILALFAIRNAGTAHHRLDDALNGGGNLQRQIETEAAKVVAKISATAERRQWEREHQGARDG